MTDEKELIDFVLPWVDPFDDEWRVSKHHYENNGEGGENNKDCRYRELGLLKYVLRGIDKNCSWYNKIYLITCGHYPEWLDISSNKIKLVRHDEMYANQAHLPTFCSTSIEMNLLGISGLSNKFVYLNDDMVVARSLSKERFFREGLPVDYFYHGWVPRNRAFTALKGWDPWVSSLKYCLELANRVVHPHAMSSSQLYHPTYSGLNKLSNFIFNIFYKKAHWIRHWHHPQPYLLETIKVANKCFSDEMALTSSKRFRDGKELCQYLYRYIQLLSGRFYAHSFDDGYMSNLRGVDELKSDINRIERNKAINFVCFNDNEGVTAEDFHEVKPLLLEYLESILSEKASFEL